VLVEAGYVLERAPDTVRGPDVSFVSLTRLPVDRDFLHDMSARFEAAAQGPTGAAVRRRDGMTRSESALLTSSITT
jgi:hypothetical protein